MESERRHTLVIIDTNSYQACTCISSAVFYYLLANLSPQYRSSLQNIQLITLARTQDVTRYGVDKILEPFMEDIKQLEKVSLITFINPRHMHRRVTVVVLCVCLSVTTLPATYLIYTSQVRLHRVLYGIFKALVV